ncbi:hypothetical protein [Stenotrophomonas rhizophila]|uniref:Transmembrane protein n=1 Tax=Stenotrophomonas rhizophila TaxID=216778 RepID=A0A7V7YJB5_9GAMM|nr:hypothetical protein [Stenotrophomonas rhizophila]KAB7632210.1 hypothetical protein F9K92_03010 [Stenotrophomonas rhizophila]
MRTTGNLLAAGAVTLKVGVVFWVLVAWRTPGGEPWDAPAFWTVVYPLALAIAAVLGACFPRKAWLWGLLLMVLQVPVVAVMSGVGPLLLAGLVYALVLALPAMAIAAVAGALRRRLYGRV